MPEDEDHRVTSQDLTDQNDFWTTRHEERRNLPHVAAMGNPRYAVMYTIGDRLLGDIAAVESGKATSASIRMTKGWELLEDIAGKRWGMLAGGGRQFAIPEELSSEWAGITFLFGMEDDDQPPRELQWDDLVRELDHPHHLPITFKNSGEIAVGDKGVLIFLSQESITLLDEQFNHVLDMEAARQGNTQVPPESWLRGR